MNSSISNKSVETVLEECPQVPLEDGADVMVDEQPKPLENAIYISDKAKAKVINLMQDAGLADDASYFLRVGVVGGGCSGLSYKMDFDNEQKPMDQAFEDKGVKIVTDLKSFLYLVNTELEFSDGLNGKGFYFNNPNASRSCGCGESFAV
jgi:iron-sulfur cluster assembly protein